MERQAGLGRSLEEVLDSLTPTESESAAGRVLFEPEDIEQQLDQLMGDIRDLRERVQHLVGMVPDGVVLDGARATELPGDEPRKGKGKKQHKNKKRHKSKGKSKSTSKKHPEKQQEKREDGQLDGPEAGDREHLAGRNGSAPRKTE